jgi:glyoxylase-like metal-dependent hydrolase (beta-lactamase superfamily II)
MRRWLKRLLVGLGVLVVVLLVAKLFLLDRAPVPDHSTFAIDLAALRKLATPEGAALPDAIEVVTTGHSAVPRTMAVAGGGFGDYQMAFTSWRIKYPDGTSIVVDSAMDADLNKKTFGNDSPFDAAAFEQIRKAMSSAQKIIFTHEHVDHLGGVHGAPDFDALVPKLMLTKAQLSDKAAKDNLLTPEQMAKLEPFVFDGPTALAPGVALLPAPGHSPGSQLVFVHLAGGQELLLVGDIGWSNQNITDLVGRPYVLSKLMLHEDRDAVANQLRALHDLAQANPALHLVAAHDHAVHESLVAQGIVHRGFSL